METIIIKSSSRVQMIDVTAEVNKVIGESKVKEGNCLLFTPHTTTAVTINENTDSNVIRDIIDTLNAIVPPDAGYSHMEGNSQAHILSSLIGASIYIPIKGNALLLGQWQGAFFMELDGPRTRKLHIQVNREG